MASNQLAPAVVEELDVIEAIYPGTVLHSDADSPIVLLKLPDHDVSLQLSFPSAYPEDAPPHILQVYADRSISEDQLKILHTNCSELMNSCFHNDVCLFDFIAQSDSLHLPSIPASSEDRYSSVHANVERPNFIDPLQGWTISDPVIDRSSTFIGYAIHISHASEVPEYINRLRYNSKLARASHLISAWKIQANNSDIFQSDCDDNGESMAGSKILRLIDLMNVCNLLVVVARWYGGVHLGPSRFRHIANAAREAIIKLD